MADTSNLEATIGGWYEKMNLPHLPKEAQKWLANNVWWLALVGAILSVLGIVALVPLVLLSLSATAFLTAGTAALTGYTGLFWFGAIVSVVSYVVTTVLLLMAVNPLKAKAKRGWQLLFWSYLVNFGLAVLGNLVVFNIASVIGSLIGAAIAGYFMYEIRGYFGAHHKVDAKKAHGAAKA